MRGQLHRLQTPVASTAASAAAAIAESHTSSPSKDHPTAKGLSGGSSNSSASYFSRLSEKTMERWRESSVMGGSGAAKKSSGSLAEENMKSNVPNDATKTEDATGSGGGGGDDSDNTLGDGGVRGDRSDRDGGGGSVSQGRLSRSSSVASSVCRTERSVASTNYSGVDTASIFGGGSQRSSFKGGTAGAPSSPSNPSPQLRPSKSPSRHPSPETGVTPLFPTLLMNYTSLTGRSPRQEG